MQFSGIIFFKKALPKTLQITLFSVLCALILVNCGFHLKTDAKWSTQYTTFTVKSNENSSLVDVFKERLIRQKRSIVNTGADLNINFISQSYKLLEIGSSTNNREREYILTLTIVVSATNNKDEFLLSNETFEASRDVRYDETNLFGREEADQITRKEIENQTIDAILRRIQALTKVSQ